MVKIIAEIGINHNGDPDIASQLIAAASAAGADYVKLQKRTPMEAIPEDEWSKPRDTPWGMMSYLAYKTRMEFPPSILQELERQAWASNVPLFYSVWDLEALQDIVSRSSDIIKIPSAKITDLDLIEAAAGLTDTLILSTGMSTDQEIKQAWHTATQYLDPEAITVLHCHSAYPAPSAELNLRVIQTLQHWFPRSKIGYSGHEFGIEPTVWAVVLGAEVIERHLTLDRTMWGTDQMASVEPIAFERMVKHIRSAEAAIGTGKKVVWDSELPAKKKLRG